MLEQKPEERAESCRHQLCSLDTHGATMPQNKIRDIRWFELSKREPSPSKALDQKLSDERLVADDRRGDQPAFRAQMLFVSTQNVSKWRFIGDRLSGLDNGAL